MRRHRNWLAALLSSAALAWLITSPCPCLPDEGRPQMVMGYSSKSLRDVDVKDATAALRVWIQEMGRQEGISAGSQLYDNMEPLIKDTQAGKIDMIAVQSLDYLRMRNRIDTEPAVLPMKGGRPKFSYQVLVSRASGISSIEGLRNKTLSLLKTDEISLVYLNTLLLKRHLPEARAFFSSIDEKTKVSQVVLSVFFNQSDVCVIDDVAFKTMCELNPQVGEKLHVLAASPDLAIALALFRRGCPSYIKDRAIDFLTRLKQNPRGQQVLMLFKIDDLTRMKESDLDSIKSLAAEYERLKAATAHARAR